MNFFKSIFLILFSVLFSISIISASESHQINPNSFDKVWEFGHYNIIENNCEKNIFIPTKTESEYLSFLNNHPSCAKIFTSTWKIGSFYECTANPTWSSFSSCSVSCGTGSQSRSCSGTSGTEYRTVNCTRSDGLELSDSFCYQNKPITSQTCTESCVGSSSQSCYAGSCYSSGSCFLPGTKITLSNGNIKNIEDINVGDKILTYDEKINKFNNQEVLELENPIRNHYYTMFLSDFSSIKLTDEHPIYSKIDGEKTWASINPSNTLKYDDLEVEKLSIGDRVFTENNDFKMIISLIKTYGKVQTYNLKSISNTHTFFANGILVHNKDSGMSTGSSTGSTSSSSPSGQGVAGWGGSDSPPGPGGESANSGGGGK